MNFQKLDRFLEQLPDRGIPACDLLATVDGTTVYRKQVGFADVVQTRPVSDRDLYWIFSCTKLITCTAALRLIEEGRLSLEDPVSKYLPGFQKLTVRQADGSLANAKTAMTVEHLFTMAGGFSYNIESDAIRHGIQANAGTVELANAMAKEPLLFEPGSDYHYSLCHDVLGAVVEQVAGMRFSEYLKQTVFDPLEMPDTGFHPTADQLARFSTLYHFQPGKHQADPIPIQNKYTLTPFYDGGGGGLFSSVADYTGFLTALACGGIAPNGYRLLRPHSLQQIQQNRLNGTALNSFVNGRLYGYGWGLCGRVHIDPVYSLSRSPIGEFGWEGAAGAFAMVDCTNRIALYFSTHILKCSYLYHVIHPILRNLFYEGLGM